MRGLTCSLIQHGEIVTTLPKAKELRRGFEKLITLAKRGDLASRRLLIARVGNIDLANGLMDDIVKDIKRDSGYLRITREGYRRGDNAEMARIAFVDEIKAYQVVEAEPVKKQPATKSTTNSDPKPAAKPAAAKETK
ncbi:50S ribosomal protein L17 [Candidatus Saccharibacteria bacterium]|nr:50S ribosomal protein L17 [Candidatus Saccharibacteria bacterium]